MALAISEKSVIRLHPLERQVLEKLLTLMDEEISGDDLKLLRLQLKQALILSREMTGHGFYTAFHVPDIAARLPNRSSLWIGGISADVPGLEYGAGFQLYVKDGAIDLLEGFSYDGPWPDPWPGHYDEDERYFVIAIPHVGTGGTTQ